MQKRGAPHGSELQIECFPCCRDGMAVQRHVDEARVPALEQGAGSVADGLPVRAAGLIEVNVRVDAPGEYVQARRIDLLAVAVDVAPNRRDGAVLGHDVSPLDATGRDHRPAANNQLFASSSMNRFTTSMATATSAALTDSAGL